MRRREFITLLSGAAAWVSPARAQEPRKVIGILTAFGFPSLFSEVGMPAFFQGLKEAGFVEGRNINIEIRQVADVTTIAYPPLRPHLGIELLADNIAECRANLLEIFADYLNLDASDNLYRAASYVLSQNLMHGDALTMRTHDGQPITFAEWGYLGKGKFQRRGFALRTPEQARNLHADQDLPDDDGKGAG